MSMYEQQLVPELQSHGVRHQLIKTEYAGHARKVASELDLAEYSGIVCISGDGLVHEVYNGLYSRKDWDEKASKYDCPLHITYDKGEGPILCTSFMDSPYLIFQIHN